MNIGNAHEVIEYKNPDAELAESITKPEMNIGDFQFGPRKRKEGESYADYRDRLELEKFMFKARMKMGVSAYGGHKGQFINHEKQILKAKRLARRNSRIRISRLKRKEMGIL